MQVLDSISNGSRPDNPTLHLTFTHFFPFRILARWLSLTENLTWSKIQRWMRDPSLTAWGWRCSLKQLCCFPGAGPSPLLDLGGPKIPMLKHSFKCMQAHYFLCWLHLRHWWFIWSFLLIIYIECHYCAYLLKILHLVIFCFHWLISKLLNNLINITPSH